ncbi:MAG: small ribosomal subunit Rsm22 family protein [Xanthobacteraceae bacterium]
MAFELPPALDAAIARLSEGLSRRDLTLRARTISDTYRGGGTSKPIADIADALAYALVRMPATYAAVSAALEALREARPDFMPHALLDVGAGPGTATWAVTEAFASIDDFVLLDANAALLNLATRLAEGHERLARAGHRSGDAARLLANAAPADLVLASYMIGEIGERERDALADLLWEKARDTLLVIEPGTPAGYQRILDLRGRLIAQGAHVLAPCPHDKPCPLAPPDWCHFAQRLSRSRDHRIVKDAELPFEDEKFSYVALSRHPAPARHARILARPLQTKVAITAKLCTQTGVVAATIPRRDRAAYADARRWRWGDSVAHDPEKLAPIIGPDHAETK